MCSNCGEFYFLDFAIISSINPLTRVPPLAFVLLLHDQNWHHLYLNSTEEKDLSSDTQIRVIGSMESEICTKMLRNLGEKLVANLWRLHLARNCPSRNCFLGKFRTWRKPCRRSMSPAKWYENKKKERKTDKKTNKASKFWFLRMPGKLNS